jgi:hypothetical protein
MPAARRVQARTEEAVGTPGSANYQQAQSVVASAASLKEAVENGNFLGASGDEAYLAEVRTVLEALPAEVDRAFMASLRDALTRGAKIEFVWLEHPDGGFDHSSSTSDEGAVVLVLRSPRGDTFTQNQS